MVPGGFSMIKPFLCVCLALSLFFISCSARISGNVRENGSAEVTIHSSLEPKMAALLKSFSQTEGDFSIDGAAIGKSMAAAPGIESALFWNEGPSTVSGTIKISKIGDFLVLSGSNYRFINYIQTDSGGSLAIELDLKYGPELISLFSMDVSDYLAAIMAPVATGEVLTVAEYLDLVTSVYGAGVSNEIKNARINLSLTVPGTVKAAQGGTFSKNQAQFNVPLTDILVLAKPVKYEIVWIK